MTEPASSTKYPTVPMQGLGLAQFIGKLPELFQGRLDPLFVVGGLDHIGGDHQQAAGRHRGLRGLQW